MHRKTKLVECFVSGRLAFWLLDLFERIERLLEDRERPCFRYFTITQENPMITFQPGNSPQFTATPQPDGAVLPAGVAPSWTISDDSFSISLDSTGLVATVAIPTTATPGTAATLTVSASLPDGTTPTGSFSITVVAPPPPPEQVTSFTITQTA